MKIMLVHNKYRSRGGEDAVFEMEARLLEERGHLVERCIFDNRDIPDRLTVDESAKLAFSTIWSRQVANRIGTQARSFGAEVVHFHNTFPLVSPAAFTTCHDARIAVVRTVHNYRFECPNAILFRNGQTCRDCSERLVPWPGVIHACYRESRLQTAVVATMLTTHRIRRTSIRDVDITIAQSEFALRELVRSGVPINQIAVKPNSFDLEASDAPMPKSESCFLFAGRLVEEKGVKTLLAAWRASSLRLFMAGEGPLLPSVLADCEQRPNIAYLGQLTHSALIERMRASSALIFPSIWFESSPMLIVEAFATGLPVIASRIGAVAEMVEDGKTGLLFEPGNAADLLRCVERLAKDSNLRKIMGERARAEHQQKYTGAANVQNLEAIYERAIRRSRDSSMESRNRGR